MRVRYKIVDNLSALITASRVLLNDQQYQTARRLSRFSVSMIGLTLTLVAVLLWAGLVRVAVQLVLIWILAFWLLFALRVVFRRLGSLDSLAMWSVTDLFCVLKSGSTVFCASVSGLLGVAAAFAMAGVPFASGLVLMSAVLCSALVILVGDI